MKSRVGTPSSYKRSHKKSIRRKAGKNQRRRSLALETLEERRVLSASPYHVDAVYIDPVFAPDTPMWYVEQMHSTLNGANAEGAGASEPGQPDRFVFNDLDRWTRTATDGGGLTQGDPTTITWGFVADGLMLPAGFPEDGELDAHSDLFAFLNGVYGGSGTTVDSAQSQPWFEVFQQVFDRWEELSGIDFVYVPYDDGAPFTNYQTGYFGSPGELGVRADIRIGGHPIDGPGLTLAYAYNPIGGGDIIIDTADTMFLDTAANSLLLRNTLAHEVGHALGLRHVLPSNGTKLMEPVISLNFDGPQHDDILAIQRAYGDAWEGNDTRGTAGDITWWVNNNRMLQDVSIDDNSDVDYYRFDLPRGENFTRIMLEPVGHTYQSGAGGNNIPNFNSRAQSDLALELLSERGIVLARADVNRAGFGEVIDWRELDEGTYYVRVTGTANAAQLYNLRVLNDNTPPPTYAYVSGTVWQDENGDGIYNGSESPLSGWQLYVDANNNGQYDVGEMTTFTGSDGSYSFTLLAPGTFRIAQVLPEDWEQTNPGGSGSYYVTLGIDEAARNINFGNRLQRVSIAGTKWVDVNGDGVRQSNEPGWANSTVYVDLNGNGRLDLHEPAAVTDRDGRYTISNVAPGTHTVREVLTPGWELTVPNNPHTYQVTLAPGESVANLDFAGRTIEDGASIAAPYDSIHGSPVHGVLDGFHLGAANGADDGVRFLTGMQPGQWAQVAIDVSYNNYPPALLQAWIDFNGDGDWDDAGEQIIKNLRAVEGTNLVWFQVPSWATTDPNANPLVRVRFGFENNLSPYAPALAGEVEDYAVRFPLAPDTGLVARDDTYVMDEDAPPRVLNVLDNDNLGPGGGTLRITQVTNASGGTVEIIDNGTRLRYTPAPNFYGLETFTYTVVDGLGGERQATVSINVLSVNDPPTANDDIFEVNLNSPGVTLDVLANDTTAPDLGETLTIVQVTQPASGSVVIQGTTLRYTPTPGFVGTETFTYTVSDGELTDTATVTVQVAQLPELVSFSIVTTDLMGEAISSALVGEEFVVQVYVQDMRQDGLGIYAAYLDLLYTQSLIEIVPGSLEFSDDYGQLTSGNTSIPGVIDEVGAALSEAVPNPPPGNERLLLFSARFTATTEGLVELFTNPADVIDPAVIALGVPTIIESDRIDFGQLFFQVWDFEARNDVFSVTENDQNVLLDVLANDSLGADPGDVQIQSVFGFTAGGSATVATGDAGILYTPAANFLGIETFQYTLIDQDGNTTTATVTVTVGPPVTPPTATPDLVIVVEDSNSNIIPVLGNDTLGDGNELSIVDFTQPSHGTVTLSQDGQALIYTPDRDYFGSDSFTYTITDGIPGNVATATVSITVTPVNDPPTANDDSFNVAVNSTDVTLDVLANDSIAPDEGETLTITAVGPTSHGGIVEIGDDGTYLEYTPAAGFIGLETFTYTIDDGNGGTAMATVTVNVGDLQKIGFSIQFVDPNAGTEVTQVEVGSRVRMEVMVEDLRSMPDGIGSAIINLFYDSDLLDVDPTKLKHNTDNFSLGQGDFPEPGLIENVGSGGGHPQNWTGAGEYLLFSVEFVAIAEGNAEFFTAMATEQDPWPVYLFDLGFLDFVDEEQIVFGDATLKIVPVQPAPISYYNADNRFDVNGDNTVNRLDLAYVLSDLIWQGARPLTATSGGTMTATSGDTMTATSNRPHLFVDVNNDGQVDRMDLALVLHELIRLNDEKAQANQPMAASSISTAALETGTPQTASASRAMAAPLFVASNISLPVDETGMAETDARPATELDQGWGIRLSASSVMPSTGSQVAAGATLTTVSSDPMEEELPSQSFSEQEFVSEVESPAFDLEDEDEFEAILNDIADEIAIAWQE